MHSIVENDELSTIFENIVRKYRKQILFQEAKSCLERHGYKLMLNETPISSFENTESKRFLIDVINNLNDHGYIEKTDIDKLDEEEGYIWNQLNKIAKTFNIKKIIEYLRRLGILLYPVTA